MAFKNSCFQPLSFFFSCALHRSALGALDASVVVVEIRLFGQIVIPQKTVLSTLKGTSLWHPAEALVLLENLLLVLDTEASASGS